MKLRTSYRLIASVLFVSGLAFAQDGQGVPPPEIATAGTVNGASFERNTIAPGAIVSIFGSNFGLALVDGETVPMSLVSQSIPLATSLGGYSVTIEGVPAPLFFVGSTGEPQGDNFPGQINVQVPWEAPMTGTVDVVVRRNMEGEVPLVSDPDPVTFGPVSPGLFAVDPTTLISSSQGLGIVINNSDGSLAWPAGTAAGVRPAQPGGFIQIWCSGLGPIDPDDPPPVSGGNSLDDEGNFVRRDTAETPLVTIGGFDAQVAFSGLQPQFVGVYQINVQVPSGVEAGDNVSVEVSVGGVPSQDGVVMAVAPAP